MKFVKKTDEEIEIGNLMKDGIYKAEVFDAFDVDSKGNKLLTQKGDEKIDLVCRVFDESGKPKIINCVLTGSFAKLLKHFCYSCGLEQQYENENLTAEDCKKVIKMFSCEVSINTWTGKDGKERKGNNIVDFFKLDQNNDFFNDTIPF